MNSKWKKSKLLIIALMMLSTFLVILYTIYLIKKQRDEYLNYIIDKSYSLTESHRNDILLYNYRNVTEKYKYRTGDILEVKVNKRFM